MNDVLGKCQGVFLSEKVSKVRWNWTNYDADAEYFVTGSWDNAENNSLSLWSCPVGNDGDDKYAKLACRYIHDGDVTEIKFIGKNVFMVSSSTGAIRLWRIIEGEKDVKLEIVIPWENLHHLGKDLPCSCTAFDNFEHDVVTVGEDGRIVLLTANQRSPVRAISGADSTSIRCVCFLKHNQVLTGNLRGQMKVWDLNTQKEKPSSTFMFSGEQVSAMCVTHHPTQQHTVLAGGEDGSISVWDLRQSTFPVAVLNAHASMVNEIVFHPDRPENLYTCSADGDLWHWDTSRTNTIFSTGNPDEFSVDDNPWLNLDGTRNQHEVCALMSQLHKPINSLDVNRNRIVCGCDNEAVYVLGDNAI